jgi:hypothetical protein
VYLACFIDGSNSSIDRKNSYEVGEGKIIPFGGLRTREKQMVEAIHPMSIYTKSKEGHFL